MGKRKPKSAPPPEPAATAAPDPRRSAAMQLILCLLVAAALIVVVWAVPRRTGDLYVGYAGGRDVLDGKIGRGADDWCFNTIEQKRPWLNQNWGTHLLYYLAWTRGGEGGYLVLKMAFLLVAATFMTLGARQRGSRWPVGVLVAGAMIVAGHAYIDLRPNLTTLTFSPVMLWLIVRTRGRPHRIWWAAAFLVLWANMHGGFVLGLAMLGLWAACNGIEAMVREGVKPAFARLWPLLAGFGVALVAAGVITPFGIHTLTLDHLKNWANFREFLRHFNVTHFLVVGDPAWRNVQEWHSVWKHDTPYGTTKEFFIIVALFALLAAVRLSWRGESHRRHRRPAGSAPVGPVVFDVILACVVLYMGFKARRFVTLSNLTIAPMFAALLDWLLRRFRRAWAVPVTAGVLAAVVLWPWKLPWSGRYGSSLLRHTWWAYTPDNPFRSPRLKSTYDTMIVNDAYGHDAARFLNENKIAGRAIHEWRWEGFLHWRCPQLQLYVGGRAQQVHSLQDYKLRGRIWSGDDSVRALDSLKVDFIIAPVDRSSLLILDRVDAPYVVPDIYRRNDDRRPLIPEAQKGKWVPIYYDGENIVVANAGRENALRWIRRAAAGDPNLWYPDDAVRAWSQAMCLGSRHFGRDYLRWFEKLKEAATRRPFFHFYSLMRMMGDRQLLPDAQLIPFLAGEVRRLAAMDEHGLGAVQTQRARIMASVALQRAYGRQFQRARAAGRTAEADAWEAKVRKELQRVKELDEQWAAMFDAWQR